MITTIIFGILLFSVVGKLISLAFKATWGILKIVFTVILFPVILIIMAVSGLMVVALPILIIVGIVLLIKTFVRRV